MHSHFSGSLTVALDRCQRALLERISDALAGSGLKAAHVIVASCIGNSDGASQAIVGKHTGLDRTSTMTLIGNLERAGYVSRRRRFDDRRTDALSLTQQGRAWLQEIADVEADFLVSFTRGEFLFLSELLTRMVRQTAAAKS